ncbi:50S ribosomal protein L35 [Phycisphaerae bacterium RAS1]|nr:50S ribosomal protein L35 [Phycisphaerae bacterium RAS1]
MHKRKPHKGLQKRVKVSARGKIVRHQSFRGHLLSGKSGRRKQRLRRLRTVEGKFAQKLRIALCVE